MNSRDGKKLLANFLDDRLPPVIIPQAQEHKIRMPACPVGNPRKDVPVPANMAHLPIDERGYRVPFFVSWIDGKPDFRCVKPGAIKSCIRNQLCWLCGKAHARAEDGTCPQTYVIGPMCTINHISAEPGSHFECARYAVQVCPFLIAPQMRRNEKDLPQDTHDPAGVFIKRNPGAFLLWTTTGYHLVPVGNGVLFRLGSPTHLECWREGRFATRAEVNESIQSGLPLLQAEADSQGPDATAALARMITSANELLDRFI